MIKLDLVSTVLETWNLKENDHWQLGLEKNMQKSFLRQIYQNWGRVGIFYLYVHKQVGRKQNKI